MVYSFALIKHANIRYREYVIRLGMYELLSMLRSPSIDCEVRTEEMGGSAFLTFECRPLGEKEISYLSGHSTICFMAEKTDLLLKPLQFRPACYLKEDLPEILKYKGKTSASFTRMMINICRSLLPEDQSGKTLTLLDPMCGKGTSCFCALVAGMNAVGLDIDAKDIREASEYFSRYLKINQMKHTVKTRSETAGKTAVPVTEFVFADTKEHYQPAIPAWLPALQGKSRLICWWRIFHTAFSTPRSPAGNRNPSPAFWNVPFRNGEKRWCPAEQLL